MKKKMYIGVQVRYVILRNTFYNSPFHVRTLTEIANATIGRLSQGITIPKCISYETKMPFLENTINSE